MSAPVPLPTVTYSGAIISGCARYRYSLIRRWADGALLVFVMLNPSKADANADDPTVRKCMGFAHRLDHSGIRIVNLFAWRATDPKELTQVDDPIGPDNDRYIHEALESADRVVCAWGNGGALYDRGALVTRMIVEAGVQPYALKINGTGHPAHPLYQPYSRELVPFSATRLGVEQREAVAS